MANDSVSSGRGELAPGYLAELRTIEEESQATAFGRECAVLEEQRRQQEDEQKKQQQVDDVTTEVLEAVTSIGAGGLSTWSAGGVPVGVVANYVIGTAAKAGSILGPEDRALRVACRAGKVLLHSQISITTRNLILGTP